VVDIPAEYKTKIDDTLNEIFKTIDTDGVHHSPAHSPQFRNAVLTQTLCRG
jgi:hypothetical protein